MLNVCRDRACRVVAYKSGHYTYDRTANEHRHEYPRTKVEHALERNEHGPYTNPTVVSLDGLAQFQQTDLMRSVPERPPHKKGE